MKVVIQRTDRAKLDKIPVKGRALSEAEAKAVLARADNVDAVLQPALGILVHPRFRAAVARLESTALCREYVSLRADGFSQVSLLLPSWADTEDSCLQPLSNYLLDVPERASRLHGAHGEPALLAPSTLSAALRCVGLRLQQRYAKNTRATVGARTHLFIPLGVWTVDAHTLLATPEFLGATKTLLLVFRVGPHACHLPVHLAYDVVRRAYDDAFDAQRRVREEWENSRGPMAPQLGYWGVGAKAAMGITSRV